MAVHEHFTPVLDHKIHNLGDIQQIFESWVREVFPVEVEILDAIVH